MPSKLHLLFFREIFDRERKPIAKLLQLRNPWGKFEWNGEWSDISDNWTPDLVEALNKKFGDDGIFYISIDNYLKFFTNTQICKQIQGYYYNYASYTFNPTQLHNFTQFEITETGKTFFVVNQRTRRLYQIAKGDVDYDNRFISIYVFRLDEDLEGKEVMTYLDSTCGRMNRLHIEVQVEEPGTYILSVSYSVSNLEWLQSSSKKLSHNRSKSYSELITKGYRKEMYEVKYTAAVYGPQKNVKIAPYSHEGKQSITLLREPLYNFCADHPNKQNFFEEDEKESWRCMKFPEGKRAIGYLIYTNNSKGYIYEKMEFTKLQNVNIISIIDQRQNVAKLGLDDDNLLDTMEEIQLEDYLQSHGILCSRVSALNKVKKTDTVSEDHPLKVQLTVAPGDQIAIIFEKYEETSGLEFDSDVIFHYPIQEIINEYQFLPKKNKIKYKNKPIECIESIYEHTGGVVYKYENLTSNFRVAAFLDFTSLDNLEFKEVMHVDKHGKIIEDKFKQQEINQLEEDLQNNLCTIEITNPEKQVIIDIFPGQTKVIELATLNKYQLYAFNTEVDYSICKVGGFNAMNN